ncbi:RNA-binding KH domain-containing protein RCF3-like isoform X1 [Tasmannia lanceolata]|uniref:RNA-binding KH domain-containing protein RCF3-like isoform X1 n=1 Tax=Tasmannia lanceolata TaxID=3420 RepID=UPI0040645FB5
MERSRSKRSYYYDQDYDSQTQTRTKPRYHHNHHQNHHYNPNRHRRGTTGGGRISKPQDPHPSISTSFRILCPDIKAGGVIGNSGSIIKAFRQETGAWINIHPLISGDEERIIEISDVRYRDPDGRLSSPYSPAQDALILVHDRILESDVKFEFRFYNGGDDDDEDYGPRGGRIVTRFVVPRIQVGCLLGKGGKIIEQMRMETKTQIRILPRDQHLPRCVSMSEEIVQVVGDTNSVKKAIVIISSRLLESQLRDRGPFRGRIHSPEHYFPLDDDFTPHIRSASDKPISGLRSSVGFSSDRSNTYVSRSSGYGFSGEDLVFRIMCPNDKVENVMGESDGIVEMLRGEIGVDVTVADPVPGSDERIVIISSEEGPDDELFPAQEALLHIQSRIVDLSPDEDNIITTRLLVPTSEIGCFKGRDGILSEMRRLTKANIQILSKEELSVCALGADEVIQIVGDIRAARDALVHVTSKLRSYLYREISFSKDLLPSSVSGPGHIGGMYGVEANSPNKNLAHEGYQGNDPPAGGYQNVHASTNMWQSKGTGRSGLSEQEESDAYVEGSSVPNRLHVPLLTKKTLEIVIPEHAIPSLTMRSGNKLAQISEMSGATVTLVEDKPELPERVIQISGIPEQAERAQSILQGFILSIQDVAST